MNQKVFLLCGLFIVASLLRFLPHPPNMTPIIAISVLSVACFENRYLQFGFPLLIMVVTDAVIGFHALVPVVYLGVLLSGLSGYVLKRKLTFSGLFGSGLLASIVFFCVTNFGVWALGAMYPKTLMGLSTCFVMAIPFFHNTLIATVGVMLVIYGIEKGVEVWLLRRRVAVTS